MPTKKPDKRSRLVQTAVKLAYRKGFRKTTLADIAKEAKVPLGNVFYYFKTKDEIGEAIVAQRSLEFQTLRANWDQAGSPKDRLRAFVQMTYDNRELLATGGCPVGTFCYELQKEGGTLAKNASRLLAAPLEWLEAQFRAIGKGTASRGFALQLMSSLQGVSLLANSFRNPEFVTLESTRLKEWILSL
jgi:TetR/AcrR family transcriptional regulator, transcriptional repressor for nem operon